MVAVVTISYLISFVFKLTCPKIFILVK